MLEDPKPQVPRVPVVKIDVVGNRIFIDSRDLASYVGKEHRHVLRDIDIIRGVCPNQGGLPKFEHTTPLAQ